MKRQKGGANSTISPTISPTFPPTGDPVAPGEGRAKHDHVSRMPSDIFNRLPPTTSLRAASRYTRDQIDNVWQNRYNAYMANSNYTNRGHYVCLKLIAERGIRGVGKLPTDCDHVEKVMRKQLERVQQGKSLYYAPPALRAHREFVLEAVKHDSENLQYATDELKADPEIMIEAIKGGKSLYYAPPALQAHREVVLEAVKKMKN